jgi:flagellar hook-associated protein 3 FlgL
MRITNNTIVTDFLSNLWKSQERINRLNKQLSTGNKLLRVSDDPVVANSLLRLNAELVRVGSYKSNVTDGNGILKMTSTSLDQVAETLQNVKEALSGSEIADASLMTQLSDQMDSYLALAMDVANTQYDNKYVFGGSVTTSAPYVFAGTPPQVVYQGNAAQMKYRVGDSITSVVNVTGAAAFNSTGVVNLAGTLDNTAAVNTVVTSSVTMTDANGVSHAVEMSFRKTDANTWAVSAAMPAGATDATVSGGTATVVFDPATGAVSQITRGAPLIVTPSGSATGAGAPAMATMISAGSLTEGAASSVTSTHTNVSVFNKLIELRDKLRAGIQPSSDDLVMIDIMQDVVQREEARAGSLMTSLASSDSYLTAQRERLLDLKSAKQDADLTEIGMRLKLEETSLQAALSAAAKIIPQSLMDYLA